MSIKLRENIIRILEQENIRLVDGRFSSGFVDLNELNNLTKNGIAEIYNNQGINFVRLSPDRQG